MFHLKTTFTLIVSLFVHLNVYALQTDGIVVTIKPLHSLVSGVIGDTGKVDLLLKGTESPHGFQFKPSQIRKIQQSKVLFYVDNNLETFINPVLKIAPKTLQTIAVAKKSRVKLLTYRQGKAWEQENHEEEDGHAHEHGLYDTHIWLNPNYATQMVKLITKTLSSAYPENRDLYKTNARKTIAKIQNLNRVLTQQLKPVKGKPFIVFHDAYQYFEKAYGLKAVGSIFIQPAQPLSPRRVSETQHKVRDYKVQCVFSEPQFSDRIINTIIGNSDVKKGVLDPLGADLQAGESLYFELLQRLATEVKKCLQ